MVLRCAKVEKSSGWCPGDREEVNHAAVEKPLALLLLGDVLRVRSPEATDKHQGRCPLQQAGERVAPIPRFTCALGPISACGKSLVLYEVLSFSYRFDINQRPHLSLVVKNFDRFGLNSAYLYILP